MFEGLVILSIMFGIVAFLMFATFSTPTDVINAVKRWYYPRSKEGKFQARMRNLESAEIEADVALKYALLTTQASFDDIALAVQLRVDSDEKLKSFLDMRLNPLAYKIRLETEERRKIEKIKEQKRMDGYYGKKYDKYYDYFVGV